MPACAQRRRFSLTFAFFRLRFHFRASGQIHFAAGKAGNMLRGALGSVLPTFEPVASDTGPSGLANPPRPFVFRASHLDGTTVADGADFHFDLHLFQVREVTIRDFILAFARLAQEGLGRERAPAVLTRVEQLDPQGARLRDITAETTGALPSIVSLDPLPDPVNHVLVRFLTPTELKPAVTPDFGVLLARVRDRLSTLSALYGAGPLNLDFKALGERAQQVQMTRCELQQVQVSRVSTRTGQRHSIGGFVGEAEYAGALSEFVPFLTAAQFTGIGRQTTWGKGEIQVVL